MGLPRSNYVQENEEGVYHCFSRCVRRAFLFGFDPLTHRDFSHRKPLLLDRLRHLAAIFAIDVCAYAIMATHYHLILRIRPDIVATWSDWEVATRWLTLFPRHRNKNGPPNPPTNEEIRALADRPERIAQLRKRLCSLSWFMGRLNEFIARAANKEDGVTGRFWDGRFKCQALLDDAAIVAGMAYVDLNLIRAGLAASPEDSDFTSIQTDETPELMPLPILLAHRLAAGLAEDRRSGKFDWLRPDGKTQVSVVYEEMTPKRVSDVLVSTQHADCVDRTSIFEYVSKDLAPRILGKWYDPAIRFFVNPTGSFVHGGPLQTAA